MATKTVGYDNSGNPGSYTTLAAWLAYAQGLGTLSAPEIAELMWGTSTPGTAFSFSSGSGSAFTISGIGTTSTNTLTITAAPGYSFRDNSPLSHALNVNAANGATIASTAGYLGAVSLNNAYTTISNLQIEATAYYGSALSLGTGATSAIVDSCILLAANLRSSGEVVDLELAGQVLRNSLVINNGAAGVGVLVYNGAVLDTTVVRTANNSAASGGIYTVYSNCLLQNVAVFGYSTPLGATNPLLSSSDYFATDQSSIGSTFPGSHTLTGVSYSSAFNNDGSGGASSADFRVPSGSALVGAAGNPTVESLSVDIAGTTRLNPTTYGCWEGGSSGGGGAPGWIGWYLDAGLCGGMCDMGMGGV